MVHKVIYAMRGWVAFHAFTQFSNSIRCFFDEKEFIRGDLLVQEEAEHVTPLLARLMGRYCLMNFFVLVHCALCIHHIPIIVLSICSLTLSILFYGSEAFYYYSFEVNFSSCFPIFISMFTIICLMIAPYFLDDELSAAKKTLNSYKQDEEEDDDEIAIIKQQQRAHKDFQMHANKPFTKKIH